MYVYNQFDLLGPFLQMASKEFLCVCDLFFLALYYVGYIIIELWSCEGPYGSLSPACRQVENQTPNLCVYSQIPKPLHYPEVNLGQQPVVYEY